MGWKRDDSEPPDTLRDSPRAKEIDDSDYGNRFTSEERITANLRLRSIAPAYRAFLGMLAFIPAGWRGPLACLIFAILGFLAAQVTPQLVEWIRSK